MSKRTMRVLAVVGVMAVLGAACSKKSTPAASNGGVTTKNVKIAFFGALSGDYKLLVISGYNAAQLAFEQFNASQKAVHVELLPEDTQGSPDQAVPLVDKVVNDSAVVGIMGPAFSGESGATGDRFNSAGIPFITQSATDDALSTHGWTHWFRAVGNNSSEAAPAAAYIATKLKPNCTFIASDGSAYGHGLAAIVQTNLTTANAPIKPEQTVQPGQKDYSALVTKIAGSGCKAVFYGGYSPEGGLIRKQMTDAGLKDVQMLGGDGLEDSTFTTTAGAAGDGTIAVVPSAAITGSTSPAAQKFVADYKAKFGEDPAIYGGEGYDIAQIYIAAFKKGITDRQGITDFVHGLKDFPGLTKNFTWQANGELDPASVIDYFYTVQGGAWVVTGSSKDVLGG